MAVAVVQTFGAEARRDDGFAHRHCLVQLQPRAAAGEEGDHLDGRRRPVRHNGIDRPGYLHRWGGERQNAWSGRPADDAEPRIGQARADGWPDFAAEELHGIDVRFVAHGTDEDDEARVGFGRRWPELAQVHAGRNGGDSVPRAHRAEGRRVSRGRRDDVVDALNDA